MKLYKLRMISFRGHKDTEIFLDDSLTTIIGKNDVGKSTVLEALEIFFNNDVVKLDVEDCNVKSEKKEITIEVTFELEKYNYTVDTIPTDLREEFLLDDGRLTIRKTWGCTGKSITASSLKTYLVADYPKELEQPLVCMKIAALKKELEKFKDQLSVKEVNKTISSEIRRAIYRTLESPVLEKIEIPLDKEDGKKVWESLSRELPVYCLFQSDRSNRDTDKEIQDPLKAITKSAIAEVEEKLESVKEEILSKAEEIGKATLEKLNEMNPDIAKVLSPEMSHKDWHTLFSFSFKADDGISMNKRGSGVRRLIMLNYFRAEAERKTEGRNVIYAIEEPETSQHPDWQKQLVESLIVLSKKSNTQVLITTHSPYLTKLMELSALRFIKNESGETTVKQGGTELIDEVIETLGLLPSLTEEERRKVRVVLCLEGPTDVKFFNKVGELFGIDLETDSRVIVLTVGGSTVKHWVNRDCLKKLGVNEIHIYDRDGDEKYKDLVETLNGKERTIAKLTSSNCIECYYHPDEVYKIILKSQFERDDDWQKEWATKDIVKAMQEQLKRTGKDVLKARNIKKNLADFAPITEEQLEELGVLGEVSAWFDKIKELANS